MSAGAQTEYSHQASDGKFSAVRWSPYSDPQTLIFAAGSYSEPTPRITTYACRIPNPFDDPNSDEQSRPFRLDKIESLKSPGGDVTALCWIATGDMLMSAGTEGLVSLHRGPNGKLSTVNTFSIHQGRDVNKGKKGIRGMSLCMRNELEIATVGADGRLLVSAVNGRPIYEVPNADAMSATGVQWRTMTEIVTSSTSGHITLFDTREKAKGHSLADQSNLPKPLNCLGVNTTSPDKIVTGDVYGGLAIWDLRNLASAELQSIPSHQSEIWDVMFHPDRPTEVISCSEDGSICLTEWTQLLGTEDVNVNTTTSLQRLKTRSPLGYNTVDCHGEKNVIVGAGDAGSFVLAQC
ncbi:WD40-repeat-containing domain protein [Phlyctochytrium arcticum]|nr:WD40-repeat-containing domain protein [Phlyctochytrium arcticum]